MEGRHFYYTIQLACFRNIYRQLLQWNNCSKTGIDNLQKKNREDLLHFFTFGIPVFHCYGHKMKCQVCMHPYKLYVCYFNIILQLKYSPRNVPGFGLSDGEVVERLWSYLRRFSRMSKEMRPSHRLDVICDLHFTTIVENLMIIQVCYLSSVYQVYIRTSVVIHTYVAMYIYVNTVHIIYVYYHHVNMCTYDQENC